VFVLGYIENTEDEKWESPGVVNKEHARTLLDTYSTSEAVDGALTELRQYWDSLLGQMQVTTDDPRIDRLVNVWNQYQCMVTFNMSRSASFFETGLGRGMGFRDSSQDLLGFVHLIPDRARERILDVAATQFPDGSAYHQYQPLTKRGNDAVGTGFNDDPLWLIQGSAAYIFETGDLSILDEDVPFDNDPEDSASLFEHLRRSYQHVLDNLGPHGLPLIGRADWNDCLNLNAFSTVPGESFQTSENRKAGTAESVFIAGLFVHSAGLYAQLLDARDRASEAATVRAEAAAMSDVVLEHGWDGEWFLRAYDAFGEPIGSSRNEEGQIFIESNGICSMAGIGADSGRPQQAADSVRERLDTDHGIVVLQPAFTRFHVELGEISTYPPGYKENASVFCHTNPWMMITEAMLGNGEQAFAYWSKIAPTFREEISDVHRTEPYVYAQTIAGPDAPRHGEAKNSWLTGTAAWNWVAITQYILGIRPEIDGLRIDPQLPSGLDALDVVRHCRGAEYRIHIDNTGTGTTTVAVNGKQAEGLLVPYAPVGAVVEVTVAT
jgi:cellobiose phosphorylase